MKNKAIITLLALTMTAAMLVGCGKETAEVQTADTETAAEVSTETKAVVVETETEESTEDAELVYNTETDTEVVAKGEKSDKADAKTDSTSKTKDSASKTDSKDSGTKADTKTETKTDSAKNDSANTGSQTQAPAETPAETPSDSTVSDQPTTGPQATTAKCPYTVNTWMDMGDGWWGCYKAYIDSKTPEENATIQSEVNTWLMDKMANENLTYDNSSGELIGNYDGISSVQLDKFHLVPAPEGAYDPQD